MCCPCGPDRQFYGHKPTCWREWDAPAEVWRDTYCPPPVSVQYYDQGTIDAQPHVTPMPELQQGNGLEPLPQPPAPGHGAAIAEPASGGVWAQQMHSETAEFGVQQPLVVERPSDPAVGRRTISERLGESMTAIAQMVDDPPAKRTRVAPKSLPTVPQPAVDQRDVIADDNGFVLPAGTLEIPAASNTIQRASVYFPDRHPSAVRQAGGLPPRSRANRSNAFVR